MRSAMDEKTFMNFYKTTVLGYSANLQRQISHLLEEQNLITFDEQRKLFEQQDVLYFESKKDLRTILTKSAMDVRFVDFYEKWEFVKLYKYSVPLFYESGEGEEIVNCLQKKQMLVFKQGDFKPEFIIDTSLKDSIPLYMVDGNKVFVKFVLQKTYIMPDSFEQMDYRYPIVIYFDKEIHCLEIRYDSTKYNSSFDSEQYESMVNDCIEWLKHVLNLKLYNCEHGNTIEVINDKQNEDVKMYKQMMEMSSGGSAELTASQSADYVLPFIGEIRELIDENEELFSESEEIKLLLLQYLNDKEATARYPYIYIKWVKPVESQSYIVKVTFDYISHQHTMLQHITGSCKDLGMGRMNDANKYLCESGSFIKGDAI